MRTFDRVRSYSPNAGMRIGSLIMLGVIVVMLASVARQPGNWQWLVVDEQQAESPESHPVAGNAPAPKPAAEPTGPTDEDREQADAAREELQAVTDRSLKLYAEEMPAYWRTVLWTQSQSTERLLSRVDDDVTLHDLVEATEKQRGKIVKQRLTVNRILPIETPTNSAGVTQLYEVWGTADQKQGWLYVGIVPELPAGMPVGPIMTERATLVGYFFKMQGYYAAESNQRLLMAPLLIGRLEWTPVPPAAPSDWDGAWWLWVALGGAALAAAAACAWPWLRRPPARRELSRRTLANRVAQEKNETAGLESGAELR